MRSSVLLFPFLLVSPAFACLNDRDSDSLATQAKQLPETLRVITGRFERNPPLFYEMRIKRSEAALKRNPRQLNLYDDIAVSYDRLHKDDDALRVMEQKRALLSPYNGKNAANKEAWYRYYANAGTFYAHRWLSEGGKKEEIGEIKKGRDFIKRAIQIKPDAHFKREKYQLMTMEWLIATKERKGGTGKSLQRWIADRDKWGESDEAENTVASQSAVEGLAGLVVLGAAWQSVDIFHALAGALDGREGTTLRYMALLRCRELMESGKKSLSPATLNEQVVSQDLMALEHPVNGFYIREQNRKALDELYPKLRAEADSWDKDRTSYLLTQLDKGKHPDSKLKFWGGYNPAPPPSLELPWEQEYYPTPNELLIGGLTFLGIVLVISGLLIWGIVHWFKRRKFRLNVK